ncbi:MAG: hypothetical protein ACI81W_004232, partial [Saprospiraceae bacterium]
MKAIRIYLFFFFSMLFSSFSLSAQTTVLTNLGEPNATTRSVGDVTGMGLTNLIIAQEFVTGSTAYTAEPITVTMNIATTGGAATFQVDIYDQSVGDPNISILTLTGSNIPSPGNALYTGNATLAASTSYYIVVSAPSSTPTYQINSVNTGNITSLAGFTAPDEVRSSSVTGSPVWGAPGIDRNKFALQIDNLVLPVELVEFKGNFKEKAIMLEWATASETDNEGFEIERSTDGRSFDFISFVEGNGNSTEIIDYSYQDSDIKE